MKNLGQMMKQVQEMQDKMQLMQDKMNDISIDGVSGAGMVTATLNGKGMVQKIKIDPTIINPQEVEILEDLIVAAVNDARSKVDIKVSEKMQEVSGGLSLPPGFKLPF